MLLLRRFLKFIHKPGFADSFKSLGFDLGRFAVMLAAILQSVRLLPDGHPYTLPQNIGKFGFRDVISAAASRLEWRWSNIDQIGIFLAIVLGLVMIVVQAFALVFMLFAGAAQAGAAPPGTGLFTTPNPDLDYAFTFIRRTFGVDGIFGTLAGDELSAFHPAIHAFIGFYNTGLLVIAVLILLYYIMVVVMETARDGVPFGKRFDNVWAPLRLVVALGLLVPINNFNASQYLVFYAAKFGSGFATQAWQTFIGAAGTGTYLAKPNTPAVNKLVQSVLVFETCRIAYNYYQNKHGGYLLDSNIKRVDSSGAVGGASCLPGEGARCSVSWSSRPAGETPDAFCGKLEYGAPREPDGSAIAFSSAEFAQLRNDLGQIPGFLATALEPTAEVFVDVNVPDKNPALYGKRAAPEAEKTRIYGVVSATDAQVTNAITSAYNAVTSSATNILNNPDYGDRGWLSASLFYNDISQWNGKFANTAKNLPVASHMPELMAKQMWDPRAGRMNHSRIRPGSSEFYIRKAMDNAMEVYKTIDLPDTTAVTGGSTAPAGSENNDIGGKTWIGGTLRFVFGLDSTYTLLNNPQPVNPIAEMGAIGNELINKSIVVGSAAVAGNVGAGLLGAIPGIKSILGAGLGMVSGLLMLIAVAGAAVGVFLFYFIPLMPFIYFTIGAMRWVKGLLEAMMGMPLWALAHLRIDGDGLPGPAASNGYYMLFQTFLRPIMMLFGLLVGILIFGATMELLHSTYLLYINSLGDDFSSSKGLNDFVFTIIYTYLAYLVATSCFKLIDLIPSEILRYIGQGNPTAFSDGMGDITEQSRGAAFAAGAIVSSFSDSMSQNSSRVGGAAGEELRKKGQKGSDPANMQHNTNLGGIRGAGGAGGARINLGNTLNGRRN